ncbi:uncharacterized protein F4807DRAFT_472391 [Annulohypoxylon truncatum]|uniref:uncharacterized protein n=1 Tax=Annulohypoxylon truncatum TaxID=327061 RepID=UPI002008CA61|nr:uncharacterized protein F4807DRAFT_472391 [Annulohypoxylon truncatum]KAI1204240.1 hypothetical protein F4807DRAFT_472391 [Annulohypoxylon truncatum]
MSGLPNYSALSSYCTCEQCLYGCQESCVRVDSRDLTWQSLANSRHKMLEIGFTINQQKHYVTCHSSLLCYWSATIKNAVYSQANPVHRIWIESEQKDEKAIAVWSQIVQWCYTGRLFDPSNVSDASIGSTDDIEVLWTVAISLEMNELANYCMRLIIMKYSWGFSTRANSAKKIHPRDCPFDAWGPYHAFVNCYKLGNKNRQLLEFMEELISAGGPLAPRKRERANPATIQSWHTVLEEDEDFHDWINLLGGVEHEAAEAILPTHFNQWDTYMVPLQPRIPENIRNWSEAHDAKTQRVGQLIDLRGTYQNQGNPQDPDYQWMFQAVAVGWI